MIKTVTRERPILFSGEMVRAILSGAKTQTRRIVKPQPVERPRGGFRWGPLDPKGRKRIPNGPRLCSGGSAVSITELIGEYCPYGGPGDRLWVRETWQQIQKISNREYRTVHRTDKLSWAQPIYAATCDKEPPRWMPSIHMPRWASRLTLEITDVRVQKLTDISADDCLAEGIDPSDLKGIGSDASIRRHFAELWDKINGKGAWERNPWVWDISFRRVEDAHA